MKFETVIAFREPAELASALRAASEAHHAYELKTGRPDAEWAEWYAQYVFDHKGIEITAKGE